MSITAAILIVLVLAAVGFMSIHSVLPQRHDQRLNAAVQLNQETESQAHKITSEWKDLQAQMVSIREKNENILVPGITPEERVEIIRTRAAVTGTRMKGQNI